MVCSCVKVLLDDLASKFSEQEVLYTLQHIPKGLDTLYVATLSGLIAAKSPLNRDSAITRLHG